MQTKQLIVGFEEDIDLTARKALHKRVGAARWIRELAFISADLVVVTARVSVAEAIDLYEAEKGVRYAEPNHPVQLFDGRAEGE